ncbi:MAG: MlaA family lipoprotein [Alphaproteobacteria bacterium]
MKINRIKLNILALLLSFFILNTTVLAKTIKEDPFEAYNRPMFEFNNIVDKVIFVPIATAYNEFVPDALKQPFENLLGQLRYPIAAANHLLQGNVDKSIVAVKKLSVNMILTLGTGHIKLEDEKDYKHTNLNTTLNIHKVDSGPYIVLPFLPPNTTRGHIAGFVDQVFVPIRTKDKTRAFLYKGIVTRSHNIDTILTVEDTSVDYYAATRDIILQKDKTAGIETPQSENIQENFDFSDEEDLGIE